MKVHSGGPTHPRSAVLATVALTAVVAGLVLQLAGDTRAATVVWAVSCVLLLVPLIWDVARTLISGRIGVDAIALLAILGALALGEYLAGAVVALMLSGGLALEEFASGRARRALVGLVERSPKTATVRRGDGLVAEPVERVLVGDRVLVKAGEIVPTDGRVLDAEAALDESALTGEPLPVSYGRGDMILSGSANAGGAFEMVATRPASESAYAALVRLVEQAEESRAPFVRMADRYAALLLPFTLVVAGAAWIVSGDPVRALAVLVVATPCPLILAAPVAIVAGISRAAHAGVIVKGGTAIEALAQARTVLFDKTGTVTVGAPTVDDVIALNGVTPDRLLGMAAAIEQFSAHTTAAALVGAARLRAIRVPLPDGQVDEGVGQGAAGRVEGHEIVVGSAAYLRSMGCEGIDGARDGGSYRPSADGGRVYIAVDNRTEGVVVLGDHIRPEALDLADRLRDEGVRRIELTTGDDRRVAEEVGRAVGVDRVHASCSPADKLALVTRLRADADASPVIMVGDGINDAPALAAADVGIGIGAAGATAASEAAGVMIMDDRIGRVVDAVQIAKRSMRIARQSVIAGLGMSFAAMLAAAAGLAPVWGAVLQEAIDVAVILNALRALRG